jgi:predicted nucleic-acid-binding protein
MIAFLDTNIVVRWVTGDPPDQARRARTFLEQAEKLLLTDLVVAEIVYVLASVYEADRREIADVLRAVLSFRAIAVLDAALLLRALELYEVNRLDFAEAYLVASAEVSAVGRVASYDRDIDRVGTVERVEPA